MATSLHPDLIELTYNAALKAFWRKEALRKFLRECNVKDAFIATWASEESKRDFLDRLFATLQRTDSGRGAVLRMARFLATKKQFPDLQGWEESEQMLRAAKAATSALAEYLVAENQKTEDEEARRQALEAHRERQQQARASAVTLSTLEARLGELSTRLGTQQAGYDFQSWFYDLMDFSEIVNRRPYNHDGRQIDGSVTLSGTTYLVELKFQGVQAGATDIDSLSKKVSGKADNTMGIMVSISGYSAVAVKEASGPRTPLLLLDHAHLYTVLTGTCKFAEVVDRVRRHASQTGNAYLPVTDF